MRKYFYSLLSPVTSNCRQHFFFFFNYIWKKEQKHTTSETKKKSERWKTCEIRLRKEIRTRNLSENKEVECGMISWVTPKWNAKETSHGVMLLLSHQEDSGNPAHSNSIFLTARRSRVWWCPEGDGHIHTQKTRWYHSRLTRPLICVSIPQPEEGLCNWMCPHV